MTVDEKLAIAIEALKFYGNENIYFPRNIIRRCQEENFRLAPIYSEFGETANDALNKINELNSVDKEETNNLCIL